MTDISSWSTAAASNNAASPNGFPEGMAPSGVNDSAREVMAAVRRQWENAGWLNYGHSITYSSGTAFTIASDKSSLYTLGRRIKVAGTATGTIYGTITSSVYSAPNLTVGIVFDSGSMSNETLAASLSTIEAGQEPKYRSEVITKTSNFTVDWSHNNRLIYCDASTGAVTATLPTASAHSGFVALFKKKDSSANTVTIDGNASETIDGATTLILSNQNETAKIVCDGTGWLSASQNLTPSISGAVVNNGAFTVTASANAITVALKYKDGTDPTTSNKVGVIFRDATGSSVSAGLPVEKFVTAALSMQISQGSTLGYSATSTLVRVYVYLVNNSGTVQLAVSSVGNHDESSLHTITSEGGAGGADTAATLYGTTASNVAIRLIGYFTITTDATTVGNWSAAPIKLQLMAPGVRRTGDVVQVQHNSYTTYSTAATTVPLDNTIPQQSTDGTSIVSKAITPKSADNRLIISGHASHICASSGNTVTTMVLYQDSTEDALAVAGCLQGGSSATIGNQVSLLHEMRAGTVSSTTLKIYIGGSSGSVYINGSSTARFWGGIAAVRISITEVEA